MVVIGSASLLLQLNDFQTRDKSALYMNKEILRLAIPNILSNISVPLLSTVDTALMGRMSDLHIGAVGVGAMIFNFVYWNFGFLRMGTTGLTAQAYGRDDQAAIGLTLGRAFTVVLVVAFVLMLLQGPIGNLGIQLMQMEGEQASLVAEYFFVRIWAAPATLGLFAVMGWFFGMQNAVLPLLLTVLSNIINIGLSYYFVIELGWGVSGVAWGTVWAQYAGLFIALLLLFGRYRHYLQALRLKAVLQWEALRAFLVLNRDIFIRTLLLTLAFALFYSFSSGQGKLILAVNVILLQFVNWMSYGVDGFAFAAESLVGKYAGRGGETDTRRAIRIAFGWGMGMAGGISLLYLLAGESLLRIFTNQADVLQAARPYLLWMVIFPVLSTPCYIWDGLFIGLTASKAMRNCMILAFMVFLATYFGLGRSWGNHGLWLTLTVFMLARAGFQQWAFAREGVEIR